MCGNMALKLRADGSGGTVYTVLFIPLLVKVKVFERGFFLVSYTLFKVIDIVVDMLVGVFACIEVDNVICKDLCLVAAA